MPHSARAALSVLLVLTIASPGFAQFGSLTSGADGDAIASLTALGPASVCRFAFGDAASVLDDPVYISPSGTPATGNVRITHALDHAPFTYVQDQDVAERVGAYASCVPFVALVQDGNSDGAYDPGEPVWADADGSGTLNLGDVRLTTSSAGPAGSLVRTGDSDRVAYAQSTRTDLGPRFLQYFDADFTGSLTWGDALVLTVRPPLAGLGLLGVGDVILVGAIGSQQAAPSAPPTPNTAPATVQPAPLVTGPLPEAAEPWINTGVWIWTNAEAVGAGLGWLDSLGAPTHHYENLDMAAFEGPAVLADALVAAFGGQVWPNEHYPLHLDKSVPYIEADRVRQVTGNQRDGPTVVVVDTGVDSMHPDFQDGNLAANVLALRRGGLVVGTLDQGIVIDAAGHGTHVAGIVAGTGSGAGRLDSNAGKYVGAYANGRVASYQASSPAGAEDEPRVDTVAALEAFDWSIDNMERYDIRVVTNSWGQAGDLNPDHPINQASLRLYLRGMVVIFSAGNSGAEGPGTLNRHCLTPWSLCVAAGDLAGSRTSFSSMGHKPGPGVGAYDHPDITAPGLFIHAANPIGRGDVVGGIQGALSGDGLSGPLYLDRSGTSMAAPHVAAVAALLQAANGALSPDQVMDIITATADPMADPVWRVGAGYINAREAYNLAVSTVGNRQAFIDGQEVKYAGVLSGDPGFENDPVSVGYNAEQRPSPLILEALEEVWIVQPLALILLAMGALAVVSGIQFRRR